MGVGGWVGGGGGVAGERSDAPPPPRRAAQVIGEVRGGLQAWVDKDRWGELGIKEQVKDASYKWAY